MHKLYTKAHSMYTIEERIKYLRAKLDMTQEEFAKLTTVSKSLVQQIELGKIKASRGAQLKIISTVKGLNPHWLENGSIPLWNDTIFFDSIKALKANDAFDRVVSEPLPPRIERTMDITKLLTSYFKEVDLIKELLVNKQDAYKDIIEQLHK